MKKKDIRRLNSITVRRDWQTELITVICFCNSVGTGHVFVRHVCDPQKKQPRILNDVQRTMHERGIGASFAAAAAAKLVNDGGLITALIHVSGDAQLYLLRCLPYIHFNHSLVGIDTRVLRMEMMLTLISVLVEIEETDVWQKLRRSACLR